MLKFVKERLNWLNPLLGRGSNLGIEVMGAKGGRLNVDPLILAAISSQLRKVLGEQNMSEACLIVPDLNLQDLRKFIKLLVNPEVTSRQLKEGKRAITNVIKLFGVNFQWPSYSSSAEDSGDCTSSSGGAQYLSDVDIPNLSDETINQNFSDQDARLVCLVCYKIFSPGAHALYKLHVQKHPKALLKKVQVQTTPLPTLSKAKKSCNFCMSDFTSKFTLWKHLLSSHGPTIRCTHCSESFDSVKAIAQHTRLQHEGPVPQCEHCHKTFALQHLLNRHLASKVCRDESKRCGQCQKTFVDKTRLNIHMRLHNQEKPFECPVCQKRFTQKRSLTEHQLVHTEVRQFQCEVCDKKFVQKNHLKYHMGNVHKLGSSFSCAHCDKTFAFQFQLRKHQTRFHHNDQ